ncbi:xylulokinase [Paenibacillus paeoniae]|uniref:Xylulokinase n=1 Tax=Paenibacillus paeoniae TaxID=2292705 RepID=A0A371P1J2_9BACL|nr:FGGY family carbohydrate kinase [Paenibacillus paeoniae]REK69186.1 hypothetical protein DX130_26005 [Paenibacillus paeoniae]
MRSVSLVLSIDIGSTAVKVIAMTKEGRIAASESGHYPTSSPHPGWVEQDPESWWEAASAAIRGCLEKVGPDAIGAVSFSGHMSAPILLDGDGKAVMPSILIADTRSHKETAFLRDRYKADFLQLTGNEPIDAFTVAKLLWIKRKHPEVLDRACTLLFPKDYIRYKLTGRLGTDQTDAGNSLLYDHSKGEWAMDLIQELGLPAHLFPQIHASSEMVGYATRDASAVTGLLEGTPIIAGGADMACSQLGTGAVRTGTLAITLSTSAQVVMRVDSTFSSGAGKVTYHPSAIPGTLYAMGSVFTGGLGIDWAYRLLTGKKRLASEDYAAINELCEGMKAIVPGSANVMFLPFLVGSGTPHFDAYDRATWIGLSTGQSPELLMHSVMEGITFNIRESMEVFEADGHAIDKVHLGGGGSRNAVWSNMIGDVLGKNLSLLHNRDAAAIGAAMLAGVGSGMCTMEDIMTQKLVSVSEPITYSSDRNQAYDSIYARYLKAYRALNEWYRQE